MARNEEKQLGRLNRLHLQKQHEEEQKKHPPRPHLGSLKTAEDIQKWLPSIMYDLNKSLKELEVPCYPERKIREVESRVRFLEKEYKTFVVKYRELSRGSGSSEAMGGIQIPWTDRPYSRNATKRPVLETPGISGRQTKVLKSSDMDSCAVLSVKDSSAANEQKSDQTGLSDLPDSGLESRLSLPILDGDTEAEYGIAADNRPSPFYHCDISDTSMDTPLTFDPVNDDHKIQCTSQADSVQHTSSSEKSTSDQPSVSVLVDYSSSGSEYE